MLTDQPRQPPAKRPFEEAEHQQPGTRTRRGQESPEIASKSDTRPEGTINSTDNLTGGGSPGRLRPRRRCHRSAAIDGHVSQHSVGVGRPTPIGCAIGTEFRPSHCTGPGVPPARLQASSARSAEPGPNRGRVSCSGEPYSPLVLSIGLSPADGRAAPTSEPHSVRRGSAAVVRVHGRYTGGISLGGP